MDKAAAGNPGSAGSSERERVWRSRDEAGTEDVGRRLAELLPRDAVVLLHGELGVGKTVLVRGLAAGLGVDPREVQSPSYTLIHEHEGTTGRLVHVDLYRLEDAAEIEALGLDELLAGPGLKAVEWGERLPSPPPGAGAVHLRRLPDGSREIVLREVAM